MLNNTQPCQEELFNRINEVSFAINDMVLYLDTHPCDQKALDDTRKLVEERKELLESYAKFFGPLNIDHTAESCSDSWIWATQPWPWEIPGKKGRC
ncbi:MAG: spore coat protein CotJB [Lachnospiraceae bacterium]|nr:spore coat protein CotJB [Lachnospiraceae bacterium]